MVNTDSGYQIWYRTDSEDTHVTDSVMIRFHGVRVPVNGLFTSPGLSPLFK